jgi:hypothetical protein
VVAGTGLQRNARAASVTRGEWVVGMGHDYARGGRGGKRGAAVVQAGVDWCAAATASATAHAGVVDESSVVCWRGPSAHCGGGRESTACCLAGGVAMHHCT